jgi:hypothetical protein
MYHLAANRKSRQAFSDKGMTLWVDRIDCRICMGTLLWVDRNDCKIGIFCSLDHHKSILGARQRQQKWERRAFFRKR